MRLSLLPVLLATVVVTATLPAAPQPGAVETKVIPLVVVKAAHLIDPVNGKVLDNQAVVIEADRVKAVVAFADLAKLVPAGTGARVIDLGAATLLPGLIDCHTHVTGQPENFYEDLFRKSPVDQATISHIYARRTLDAGFTTIRNVGADNYVDFSLRNAINAGKLAGPRILASGPALSATGGHGDLNGMSPYVHFEGNINGIADGVDAIRKKVRENVKYGADVIKILATAGVLSEEESVGLPQYTLEEMKAAVDEAAALGQACRRPRPRRRGHQAGHPGRRRLRRARQFHRRRRHRPRQGARHLARHGYLQRRLHHGRIWAAWLSR